MRSLLGVVLAFMLTIDVTYGGLNFRFGLNHGDTEFHISDDDYEEVSLAETYRFFGLDYNKIFVGSNGYLTFDYGEWWYVPSEDSAFVGAKMIAPYWSDIDLSVGPNSHIWYRETTEQRFLEKATKIIQRHFGGCGSLFVPKSLFIVTYEDVVSYCQGVCPWEDWDYYGCFDSFYYDHDSWGRSMDSTTKAVPELKPKSENTEGHSLTPKDWWWLGTNFFQVVLATDGCDTFAIFNMKEIDWPFCWDHNKMLFNAGDGVGFYMNPVFPTTDLPYSSNVQKAGRWVYKISETMIQDPTCANVGT